MKTLAEHSKRVRRKKPKRKSQQDQFLPPKQDTVRSIPNLQQIIGNQAVQKLLGPQAEGFVAKNAHIGESPPKSLNRPLESAVIRPRKKIVNGRADQPQERSAAEPGPMQTHTRVERFPFKVKILRGKDAPTISQVPELTARSDERRGQENQNDKLLAEFAKMTRQVETQGNRETGAPQEGAEAQESSQSAAASEPENAEQQEGAAAPAANAAQSASPEQAEENQSARLPEAEPAAQQAGPPISVPDIEVPVLSEIEKTDSVMPGYAYSNSITRGGDQPTGFGVTRSFGSRLTGLAITPVPGMFIVTGTLEHPITYQIRSGRGPDGQVDIASENDGDITGRNYATVAADLTPDMSDLNGRPPRTQFWSEDLTTRHELVHANDDKNNGPAAMITTWVWLNGQSASNQAQVQALLGQVPPRFASALLAALSTEDGEKHAYGDGAASYRTRANAIRAKGARGEYP